MGILIPVNAETMVEIDVRAQTEYGVSQSELMENAGRAVSEVILKKLSPGKNTDIKVICGSGNNGGDGFVAARYLSSVDIPHVNVEIFAPETAKIKQGAALDNLKKAVETGLALNSLSSFFKSIDTSLKNNNIIIIVDALLGTGAKGGLKGEYEDIAGKACSSGGRVFSVDIPSGLDASTGETHGGACFNAFVTIALGLPKKGFYSGMGPGVCGEIIVVDIGFPEELIAPFIAGRDS